MGKRGGEEWGLVRQHRPEVTVPTPHLTLPPRRRGSGDIAINGSFLPTIHVEKRKSKKLVHGHQDDGGTQVTGVVAVLEHRGNSDATPPRRPEQTVFTDSVYRLFVLASCCFCEGSFRNL